MNRAVLYILLGLVSLALCFLLSGMESGVFGLTRWRIRQQMRAGKKRAKLLYQYLENPENFLWTILIGNTLAAFTAVNLAFYALYPPLGLHPIFFALAFLAFVFVFYAICDLLPKMLFRLHPNRLSLVVAVPFRFIHLALSPMVRLTEWFSKILLRWTGGRSFTGHLFGSRNELKLFMQESSEGLTSDERAMISRVLDLQNIAVRQITTPLRQIMTYRMDTTVDAALDGYRQHQQPFIPITRGEGRDRRVVGILDIKTILFSERARAGESSGNLMRPAIYMNEDLHLEEALRRMQRRGQPAAIVLGVDRREIGMITLQDILKVIFGEVRL